MPYQKPEPGPELMTPGEVAIAFHVSVKQVTIWADRGKLRHIRTLGEHRRFDAVQIRELLATPGDPR